MRELTNRQREVLGFMRSFQAKYGVPPTVRELGERFKITPRAAFDHLRALERKGELQRRPSVGRTSRALTLPDVGGGRAHQSVPILGRIAAAALPARGEDVFALRVRGESMIEAHICDGDLVLVHRQDSAQPNDIVVALVESESGGEGEATVKRFFRDGSRIVLKPEHPTMAPIVVDPARRSIRILGKVIGLLRGF